MNVRAHLNMEASEPLYPRAALSTLDGVRARGHSRSASHGAAVTAASPARPSALRNRGHQRAFSHGTIDTDAGFVKGHARIGSKTDFILPPGHRDVDDLPGAGKKSGHSRQASRSESIYTLRNNASPKWCRVINVLLPCKGQTSKDEPHKRTVVPNHLVPPKTPLNQHPNGARPDNRIRTAKYTLLSFLPKNIFEQIHRIANIYFLFIALVNWFPQINAFGKEVSIIPVIFVMGVTAVKDLFEDWRRHESDKRINKIMVRVYDGEIERYKKVAWKDVRVGDILHLSNNEAVPADILMLRSSDPHGLCYIDTCDLDGESNLKQRQVPRGFIEKQDMFSPRLFRSVVEVDAPTTKIYRFHGAIVHPNGGRMPVGTENLLLRECTLKNTDYVEGIVVYAGHETKAMMNNMGPRYKRSNVEQRMNGDILWCFVFLIFLCLVGSQLSRHWHGRYPDPRVVPFLATDDSDFFNSIYIFLSFVIVLQVMIPVSLYVTIEVSKMLQVYHIHRSLELYDPQRDKRLQCRALNITEELGQIQYLFTDKTGTLTENKMVFRRCTVAGVDYNHPSSGQLPPQVNRPQPVSLNPKLVAELPSSPHLQEFFVLLALCNTVVVANHPHVDIMNASGVIEGGSGGEYRRLAESRSVTPSPSPTPLPVLLTDSSEDGAFQVREMADGSVEVRSTLVRIPSGECLASPTPAAAPALPPPPTPRPRLLNVPSIFTNAVTKKLSSTKNGMARSLRNTARDVKPIFEAESPDELALVETAYCYNCRLTRRTPISASVKLPGAGLQDYDILRVLPFDSFRKCMSVVVRLPSGDLMLFCKGADSTILSRLAPIDSLASEQCLLRTQQHLNTYARQGLRVLVMGKRALAPAQFTDWNERLVQAELLHETRERRTRELYNELEMGLTLMGATGIEDRLQEGVPETLSALRTAGIAVWLLTGDQTETAVNVAYSAKLFPPSVELLRLAARTKDAAEAAIGFYVDDIRRALAEQRVEVESDSTRTTTSPNRRKPIKKKALVVDGKTLTYILDPRSNLSRPFLELTLHCSAVLACRTTPLQKACLVRCVKEHLRMRTAAIGDGANDVSMIQAADVGLGILGNEGMQAVMASDFSMSRFKFLRKFLLIHGHWSYDRLAHMVLYFFYKNAILVFLIFWYQMYCGWSTMVMLDQVVYMLYNLIFTSLPPFTLGLYDQDAPASLLLAQPALYRKGRLDLVYRPFSLLLTLGDAFYQSIAVFYITLSAYWGSDAGLWEFGTTITTCCMWVMLGTAALETRSWNVVHCALLVVSAGSYYLFTLLYNCVCLQCWDGALPANTWVLRSTLFAPLHWLVVILSTVAALLPRLVLKSLYVSLWPDDVTRAVLEMKRAMTRGDNFLVSWSRSTSTSSIYRATAVETNTEPKRQTHSLTAVG